MQVRSYPLPILAAAGTYLQVLDIPLVCPFLWRSEDTIVETKKLNRLVLEIACGTVADVLTTPGANVLTATLGIEVIGTRASIGKDKYGNPDPGSAEAPMYMQVRSYPLHHADVQPFWDLEAVPDGALLGFMVYNHGATGLPFIGSVAAPGNDNLTGVGFEDGDHRYLNNIQAASFMQERQQMLDLNRHGADLVSPVTRLGEYWHSFVQMGSIHEGYPNRLPARLSYTDATATDEADLLTWGVRGIRG
jgi:hypothetical protein